MPETKKLQVKFNLRMPLALRMRLDEEAARNNRSLNAELVHRLKASVEGYRKF